MRVLKTFVLLACCLTSVFLSSCRSIPSQNKTETHRKHKEISPEDFVEKRAGKEVNAYIRIGITNDGIFRITCPDLINAGVNPLSLTGSVIKIFCKTQEVGTWISNNGLWNTNDYLLFPGTGIDSYYTITNVYWMGFGQNPKRMAIKSAEYSGTNFVTSCFETQLYRRRWAFYDGYRPYDDSFDNWFTTNMSYPNQVVFPPIIANGVIPNGTAQFQATVFGYVSDPNSQPNHKTRVSINNKIIGEFEFDGDVTMEISTNFSSSILSTSNIVVISQIANNVSRTDRALLGGFSITYPRSLSYRDGEFIFNGVSGTNVYIVSGFASNVPVRVFDMTDPNNSTLLTNIQLVATGNSFSLGFKNSTDQSRYAVFQDNQVKSVSSIDRMFFRDLSSTNMQAEYVIICPYAFREQVYRLLVQRRRQGLSVAVAPLPDVYNLFNYGVADADAIRNFIGYAFYYWKNPPKYVLLVGAGSHNPKMEPEYFSPSLLQVDYVPVHMNSGFGIWTSLDGWYASVDGNDLMPDVAIGRLSVSNTNQLKNVVDKIVSFENDLTNASRSKVLMVADANDTVNYMDFPTLSDELINSELSNMSVVKCYKGFPGGTSNDLIRAINSGVMIVNYFGHGSAQGWGQISPWLFYGSNVANLTNSFYPIVVSIGCINGSFHSSSVSNRCLAEIFQTSKYGASACFAYSGQGNLYGGNFMAEGLYDAMFNKKVKRLGDVINPMFTNLRENFGDMFDLQTFTLFGDPGMLINL